MYILTAKYRHNINLFFIAFSIVFPAIRATMLNIDGAGRSYLFLMVLCWFINLPFKSFKRIFVSSSIRYWFFWCLVVGSVWLFIGKNGSNVSDFLFIQKSFLLPFSILVFSAYESQSNQDKLITIMSYSFLIYMVISILFSSSTGQWDDVERGGGQLGNSLPLNGVVAIYFACLSLIRKVIPKQLGYLLIVLALYSTFWVATRKAFLADLAILSFFIFSQIKLSPKWVLLTILILGVSYVSFDYVLAHTHMGERFSESLSSDTNPYDTNFFLHLMSDRAVFYVLGSQLFLANSLFGIGLFNFMDVSGYSLPIHSEFMVQLCETGVTGSLLYVLFMGSLLYGIVRAKTNVTKQIRILSLGLISAVLIISLTAWIYDFPHYFVAYGTLISLGLNKPKALVSKVRNIRSKRIIKR